RRRAGAERVEGLDRLFQFADRRRREAHCARHPHPARRAGGARQRRARRQSCRAVRRHRRQRGRQRRLPGHSSRPVPRRAGRGDRGRAAARRLFQGGQRARQARRDLHAEGGRRRAQEAGPLEGRLRQENRRGAGEGTVIPELGHYALVLALALALFQSVVPLVGARRGDPTLIGVAVPVAIAQFGFVAFSFAMLAACYVMSDFSVASVFDNSHSAMPLIYRITSVWGNHEGSMLLWVLILAVFGALVAGFGSNLPPALKATVLAVQSWIAATFYLFILTTSNPFLRLV